MNEITKIHLARQAFTISVDAYRELRAYIDAIRRKVKDADVVDEIELRIAELLADHGISANQVVLSEDIDYVKKQLGEPTDFDENDTEHASPAPEMKRLYRDPENGMVAGVAAGLAAYFGIDAVLVRLVFVLLVFLTAGWGMLLYIVLWLLVPEAKTGSERLKMAGKPVTVNGLKEVVEQADVAGAARRVNNTLAGPINAAFRLLLRIIGVAFTVVGLSVLFGLMAAATYLIVRGSAWMQNNIFPIGLKEHLLLDMALAVAALIAVLVIIFGIAIYRRTWPVRAWVTGVLVGLIFVGLSVGAALAADVYPAIESAYQANTHETIRTLPSFSSVSFTGDGLNGLTYTPSDKYMVAFTYYDHPDISAIKTTVRNGVLDIDATNFNWQRDCNTPCFPKSYRLQVTVYAPNALQLDGMTAPPDKVMPVKPLPPLQ